MISLWAEGTIISSPSGGGFWRWGGGSREGGGSAQAWHPSALATLGQECSEVPGLPLPCLVLPTARGKSGLGDTGARFGFPSVLREEDVPCDELSSCSNAGCCCWVPS